MHTIPPALNRVKTMVRYPSSAGRNHLPMLAVVLMFAAPLRVDAQLVRGTVRDSATGRPIPAAVVYALDSLGATLARNITNEGGQYLLRVTSAAWQLRVQRIGFRMVVRRVPAPENGVAQVDIALPSIPTFLSAVRVTAQAQCSKRPDRAAAFALLEQARAGLLSTVVAREAHPAALMRLTYERTLKGTSDRIESQVVTATSDDRASVSFNAAHEAVDFVKRGFLENAVSGTTYFAPDADVLLDPGFSEGYCFHIMDPDRTRPRQIGLGFKAAEHRAGRVDIDGALWIDTVARALSDIDFRYLGLPLRGDSYRPGGRISFRDMGNGVVMVDRWNLRIIDMHAMEILPGLIRREPGAYSAHESGGEVVHAVWPDGHRWDASLGTLRARATLPNGSPAAGREIWLTDSPYLTTTDSSGMFEMTDLLPGPYRAEVLEPKFAAIHVNIPTAFSFVAARDTVSHGTVVVISARDYVRQRCADDGRLKPGSDFLFFGRVTGVNDAPVADAHIEVNDGGDTFGLAYRREQSKPWKGVAYPYKTGTDGLFQICSPEVTPGSSILTNIRQKDYRAASLQQAVSDLLTVVLVKLERDR